MKNTNQLIGCCGLDCETCDARIATLTNDNALREKTSALWTKLNRVTITPDMINCTGCRQDGPKFSHCLECGIRNCATAKGFNTCGDCPELETCSIIAGILQAVPGALDNLKSLN